MRTDSSHARDLCPRDQHGQDVGETAQLAEHHNAVGNLAREGHVAVAGQDPDTSAHTFITSTQQAPGRNTNATSITSMHHRHRRPPPVHTFTPYPPIHLADLSRPAARQPSRPGLPIPQLLPPRRRQRPHLRPVLLSSRSCSFSVGTPLGTRTPAQRVATIQDRFVLLAPVLVCFRALYSRRPDAIQVEIVIVWRGQRVTGKSTLILERSWACRACCSLLALLRRSTSHRVGTRIGEAGTRLLRRNGKQFRQRPSSLTHGEANVV